MLYVKLSILVLSFVKILTFHSFPEYVVRVDNNLTLIRDELIRLIFSLHFIRNHSCKIAPVFGILTACLQPKRTFSSSRNGRYLRIVTPNGCFPFCSTICSELYVLNFSFINH